MTDGMRGGHTREARERLLRFGRVSRGKLNSETKRSEEKEFFFNGSLAIFLVAVHTKKEKVRLGLRKVVPFSMFVESCVVYV